MAILSHQEIISISTYSLTLPKKKKVKRITTLGTPILQNMPSPQENTGQSPNSDLLTNAVDNYKKSLRNNPTDEDARYNLSYAMKLLQQSQNQDQQNKDQQNKDQQNKDQQNKDQQKQQRSAKQGSAKQGLNKDQQNKDQQNKDQQTQNQTEQRPTKQGPAKQKSTTKRKQAQRNNKH